MRLKRDTLLSFVCGVVMASAAGADSDEASIVRAALPAGLHPLLTLILDTSGAAGAPLVAREPYDAARDYGSALPGETRCDPALVYWRRGAGPAPDCGKQAGLRPFPADDARGFHCEAARAALATSGFHIASRAAQWLPGIAGGDWTAPDVSQDGAVDCRADGETAINWDRAPFGDPYIFYTGNFLNWLLAPQAFIERPIAEHMATSLAATLHATDELDVAWLRFAPSPADGGYVARAPTPAAQAAGELQAIATEPPTGGAPLAEVLAESALWLSGGFARFGSVDAADDRAFDPLAPGRYESPITHACRPVTLAYLTAGQASDDEMAGFVASALPGFVEQTGGCGSDCLPPVAEWLAQADLRSDLPGLQSVALRFLSVSPPPEPIASASSVGGIGRLDDPLSFINLVARSLQRDAAMAASPQLSAAALLPAVDPADAADVVFGLSAPLARQRWRGNLLRYALRTGDSPLEPPTVVDRNGDNAIADNELPLPTSQSAWSDAPDADLLAGGAAGRLPLAAARRLFAELGDPDVTAAMNRLRGDNPDLDRSMLGLGAGDPESISDVLDWLAAQRHLGDPGPHAPAIADYPDANLQVVYAASQDGLLQAFDAASGVERWAWMPRALLPRLSELMRDEPTTVREHGIDGPLVLHRHDPDGDGYIDTASGEHLWLLFGLGRGGNRYYAMDVSSADRPRLMWSIALPGDPRLESRAEPVVTRIQVEGPAQNAGRWVVLLGGGYDRRFDAPDPAEGGSRHALHLADAASGNLLWSAGSVSDADLTIASLDASQPSAARALDLDGDGYLDRAYQVDVTGALWRYDFASGRTPAELAQAHRLAQLGTGPQRFHATPDVSLARFADGARLAIAVGSGWLVRPLDNSIVDRFYTIFDRGQAGDSTTWTETDLYDAEGGSDAMPASAPGWYRRLDAHGAGEKVFGSAVTFDHVMRFQTWQPLPPDAASPCGPPRAVRRLYALDVRNGRSHAVAIESPENDMTELAGSGLPVALRFGFPAAAADCPGCRPRAFGIVGTETFDAGYAGDPVRTSWRKLALPPDSR